MEKDTLMREYIEQPNGGYYLVCRVRSLVTASDRLWGRMDSCAPVANRRWTVTFTRDQAGPTPLQVTNLPHKRSGAEPR